MVANEAIKCLESTMHTLLKSKNILYQHRYKSKMFLYSVFFHRDLSKGDPVGVVYTLRINIAFYLITLMYRACPVFALDMNVVCTCSMQ